MSVFNFSGNSGQRKYNLTLFFGTLLFILALFGKLNPDVAKCMIAIFSIAVGGNVGSKAVKYLPNLFQRFTKGKDV